jgi:hypothetical protein
MNLTQICTEQFQDPARQWLIKLLMDSAARHGLDPALVLAISSRETNIRNIEGDGGHGRGPMQLDDRSHKIPADWQEHPVGIIDQCCALLATYITWARQQGIPADDVEQVAVAAYNAGPANAKAGWRNGNVDRFTTGKNYSTDVLVRRKVFRSLLNSRA